MTTVTIHEAKTTLSKLIAKVLAGEEVIIAKGKEPAVKLVPFSPPAKKPMLGRFKGQFEIPDSFWDPLPDDELALWNGEGD